jgi:hypothetical protein
MRNLVAADKTLHLKTLPANPFLPGKAWPDLEKRAFKRVQTGKVQHHTFLNKFKKQNFSGKAKILSHNQFYVK